MVADRMLMLVCFALVVNIALFFMSVDWRSSHIAFLSAFCGVDNFLGLPCVETGVLIFEFGSRVLYFRLFNRSWAGRYPVVQCGVAL